MIIISSDEDKGFVVKEIYNKLVDPKRISEKDIEIKQRRKLFTTNFYYSKGKLVKIPIQ